MSPCKILVVDDEKNIRLMLSRALASAETAVDTAVNGEEALDKFAQTAYDLVLLDLMLPGIDGLQVLRRIRDSRPEVPVILLTAHGTVENAVEAMRIGAVNYLQKPFAPQELRDAVAAALARKTNDRMTNDE